MQRLNEADADKPRRAREPRTGEKAKEAGVTYLDEGIYTFTLSNGAKLRVRLPFSHIFSNIEANNTKVYASPYPPEFCD
jgi:hypothetical protein